MAYTRPPAPQPQTGHTWESHSPEHLEAYLQCITCGLVTKLLHPPVHRCPGGNALAGYALLADGTVLTPEHIAAMNPFRLS